VGQRKNGSLVTRPIANVSSMLLGLMSDVHCNIDAMRHALDELSPRVDRVLLAGDAILQYRFSNEVIEAIGEYDIGYIHGNHEAILLSSDGEKALAAPHVRRRNIERMAKAPSRLEMRCSGKRLLMVHGSPFAPFHDYVYPGSPLLARCAEVDADILVLGHTHIAMTTQVGNVLVVNPGSVGQGGDTNHPGTVSYAVLDTDSGEVRVHRFAQPAG
jgi:putative phosphoesterase